MSRRSAWVLVPALAIGLAWWLNSDEEANKVTADTPNAEAETSTHEDPCEPPESGSTSFMADDANIVRTSPGTNGARADRVEIRLAGSGRGRGLFLARGTPRGAGPGEVVACVRPALALLFEPHCATHCLGCFADLHKVPAGFLWLLRVY